MKIDVDESQNNNNNGQSPPNVVFTPIRKLLSFHQQQSSSPSTTTLMSSPSSSLDYSTNEDDDMIAWTPPSINHHSSSPSSPSITTTTTLLSKENDDQVDKILHSPSPSPQQSSSPPIVYPNVSTPPPAKSSLPNGYFRQHKTHSISPLIGAKNNSPIVRNPMNSVNVRNLDDVVQVMNTVYVEQQKVNNVNMQLNCMNLFANFGNYMNVQKLRNKCTAIESELELEKQAVSHLQGTVQDQTNQLSNLKVDLDDHKVELKQTNDKYYKSLTELGSALTNHQKMMEHWERIRVREDFAMDTLLFILSLFAVNSRVISMPLHFLSSVVLLKSMGAGQNSLRVKLIRMFCKMMTLIIMVYTARRWAIKNEFHASATIYQYVGHVFSGLMFIRKMWK